MGRRKKKALTLGDAVRFTNALKGTLDVGVIHAIADDGTFTLKLASGGRKTGMTKKDLQRATKTDIANRRAECKGMVTRKDAYKDMKTANTMDRRTSLHLQELSDPKLQADMAPGTPVKFTYEDRGQGKLGGRVTAYGKIHSRAKDGSYSIDLMNGTRKANIDDARECDPKKLEEVLQSEHGMITHKDAYAGLKTANRMDSFTQRRMSSSPQKQKDMAPGTPVTFTYEVPNPAGGMVRKSGVGKIHSREKDATYTVDLMNGARKANIDDARECDPKLLEEEFQSEHGMVTHKDAYADLKTVNTMDDLTKKKLSRRSDPHQQKDMAPGTPVKFTYEVPNPAGGVMRKTAVGKIHSREEDATYTVDLMNGARKANVDDAKRCAPRLLEEEYESEHGMITHTDSYTGLKTANKMDTPTARRMSRQSDPHKQKDMAPGTPVAFTYEVPNPTGGMVRKSGVGKIHNRQYDGTYTIDLVNGARKANIDDARECDPKLLEEEFQSEQGMITHTDSYAGLKTANQLDSPTRRRMSRQSDPHKQKDMAPGTPVAFTYEVANPAGGVMRKTGVGKIHSREKDATYTVDLVNGARKANIDDARECDPKLLEEEFQSEHGMVTHKDAYAEYHTENAQGGAGPVASVSAPALS